MSSQKILHKVFLYGTLKFGQPNHHWLTKAENGYSRLICEGKTIEKLPLVIGTRYNIPFLLDKRGTGHHVRGEVYEVDSNMLAKLDILEDYPNYYDREEQQIDTELGTMQCWLYLIRNFPEKLLMKTHMEAYSNTTEQPYCERCQRDPKIKISEDMEF